MITKNSSRSAHYNKCLLIIIFSPENKNTFSLSNDILMPVVLIKYYYTSSHDVCMDKTRFRNKRATAYKSHLQVAEYHKCILV